MKTRTLILLTVAIGALLGLWMCLTGCAEKSTFNTEDVTLVEESTYHRLFLSENMYHCEFLDHSGNVIKTEGPMPKQPRILVLGDGLIRFTLQAGTGQATQWGYFYNTVDGSFSEVFQCIWDQSAGLVAFSEANTVIVRDIFDDQGFYQKIDVFQQPFSPAAQVFTDVCFTEDGASIEITYLSGANYRKVTEVFPLEK